MAGVDGSQDATHSMAAADHPWSRDYVADRVGRSRIFEPFQTRRRVLSLGKTQERMAPLSGKNRRLVDDELFDHPAVEWIFPWFAGFRLGGRGTHPICVPVLHRAGTRSHGAHPCPVACRGRIKKATVTLEVTVTFLQRAIQRKINTINLVDAADVVAWFGRAHHFEEG